MPYSCLPSLNALPVPIFALCALPCPLLMPSLYAFFLFALFLPFVNVLSVPLFCPLLKMFIFVLVTSFWTPLPSLNALCDLFLFALFLPSSNALSVPSFLPSLCPLLKSFKFSFFVPSFLLIFQSALNQISISICVPP